MSKPVLFAGTRPYGRAENISALYDYYQGEKKFIQLEWHHKHPDITSGNYDVLVIDEFPSQVPKKCILIWHAIQGGKYIGFDQPNPYINNKLINYVIAAGDDAIPMWAKCTQLPENKILPLGMPRTDVFIGKQKGDGGTILANKRSYLYVPTFRWPEEAIEFNLNYDWINSQLTNDELFVVKAHTVGHSFLTKKYNHIIEIPSSEPSTPYLIDCDVVITDYSSIIFDGYLLNKPSVLYSPNLDYVSKRGMYMRYPQEYSSKYAINEQELLNLLRSTYKLTEVEKKCMRKVANKCDGHSCERICNLISNLNN